MNTEYCACAEQNGLFVFATDAPYNPAIPATAPAYFEQSINPAATPVAGQVLRTVLPGRLASRTIA